LLNCVVLINAAHSTLKKLASHGTWQERHFKVANHYLKYYTSKESQVPLATVDLWSVRVEHEQDDRYFYWHATAHPLV
jgi:uncharacterized membrane protein (UPF0182 family)